MVSYLLTAIMDEIIYFYPQGHEAHQEYGHPERPERVEAIRKALDSHGWWQAYPKASPTRLSIDFLKTVHSPTYLEVLEGMCRRGDSLDMDTYTTPASWQLALNAAGGAAVVAQSVWQGNARRGFALTRPPGHHATARRGMGFCLLNNIAIAAEYLLQQPGNSVRKAKRLAIVDLDLHHGNGTQDIFWKRGDVLYLSTHLSPFYPGSGELSESGAEAGRGCTANFPLPAFTGDQGFSTVMEELILPLLIRFDPEMLLVSFGFDTHWRDPLGYLRLSAASYGELVRNLVEYADVHCQGKIALVLEGGYDLQAAQACGAAVTAALLGKDYSDPLGPSPQDETSAWQKVVEQAKTIWNL